MKQTKTKEEEVKVMLSKSISGQCFRLLIASSRFVGSLAIESSVANEEYAQ